MQSGSSYDLGRIRVVTTLRDLVEKGRLDKDAVKEEHGFWYKGKWTKGTAIHVAALDPNGIDYLEELLKLGAEIEAKAIGTKTFEEKHLTIESYLQPIHIAAGTGNIEVIKALCNAVLEDQRHEDDEERTRPLLDAKTQQREIQHLGEGRTTVKGPVDHYCPIHDAIFKGHAQAVSCLLELRADPNTTNVNKQTPMHLCAKLVSEKPELWGAAVKLKQAGANLTLCDKADKTPLMAAILAGVDCDKRLNVFVRPCFADLKDAVEEDPSVALALLRDGEAWFKGMTDVGLAKKWNYELPKAKDLVMLMTSAPSVAARVMEILTREPKVTNSWFNPLPRHARRDVITRRSLLYTKEPSWDKEYSLKENDRGYGDKFRYCIKHKRTTSVRMTKLLKHGMVKLIRQLFPDKKVTETGRVNIKMLHVPDIIIFDVFYALSLLTSDGDDLSIFKKAGTQAILDFSWTHIVRRAYTVDLLLRSIELFALLFAAVNPPTGALTDNSQLLGLWSYLTMMATRDLIWEVGQMRGHWVSLKTMRTYVTNSMNAVDWSNIAVHCYFCWSLPLREEGFYDMSQRKLLAMISCLRWVQFLYRLGAYRFGTLGFKIVSIFKSFFEIRAIALITLFLFMAFAHAFAALGVPGQESVLPTFLNAFRLLFLGDGDGIDFVLALGSTDGTGNDGTETWLSAACLYGSAVIFCICVLNLFIAVHSEAYNSVVAKVEEHFYASRASVCLERMLQPRISYCIIDRPITVYLVIAITGVAVWSLLVAVKQPVAVAVLLATALLGDLVLRNRLWDERGNDPWACCGRRRAQVQPNEDRGNPDEARPIQPGSLNSTLRAHGTPLPDDNLSSTSSTADDAAPNMENSDMNMGPKFYLMWCDRNDDKKQDDEGSEDDSAVTERLDAMDKKFGDVEKRTERMERYLSTLVATLCPEVEQDLNRSLGGTSLLSPKLGQQPLSRRRATQIGSLSGTMPPTSSQGSQARPKAGPKPPSGSPPVMGSESPKLLHAVPSTPCADRPLVQATTTQASPVTTERGEYVSETELTLHVRTRVTPEAPHGEPVTLQGRDLHTLAEGS
mmetsp:Transcript_96367/g.249210  ORF Transcript_96367/g.249210 Transcript_96367/m.249210 type:complete len:1070 (+) Transcript_96367:29-3238(+)